MHLLQAQAGTVADGSEALDLGQTPADILFLSAADTEIASLAQAARARADDIAAGRYPSLRLANLMQLSHPMSVDVYIENMIAHARLVMVRALGGKSYWSYGVDELVVACRKAKVPLVLMPGDEQPDTELMSLSSVTPEHYHRFWNYCIHGGLENAAQLLDAAADFAGFSQSYREPRELLRAGLYWPGRPVSGLDDLRACWRADQPIAAVVFYRALLQAANLAPIDALIEALSERGLNPLPIYCATLKDPLCAQMVAQALQTAGADLVLNTTGFAISSPGQPRAKTPFDICDGPVLQVVLAGTSAEHWRGGPQGLSARDIAMNVALPEVDGRLLTRAVSFKDAKHYDELTQCNIVSYVAEHSRVDFVAKLASNWVRLRHQPAAQRNVALVLANYPNRDGRLGNGVGLDTPAGTINIMHAMREAGYAVAGIPPDGNALIDILMRGPTNAAVAARELREWLPLAAYEKTYATLPQTLRDEVEARWGPPQDDPFFLSDRQALAVPACRFGRVVVGIQPARGYNIDPTSSYHDPDLVPPHGYFAFYIWLREVVAAHAIAHIGKHGNLEWLPGKALALSEACYPEAVLGPIPHIYPFIVNDPGEGTQAKRRAQAIIIDHLTPPLTRAESYGPLAELERLVDEYYEAAGVDPRRLKLLQGEILELVATAGLDKDCGIEARDSSTAALSKLDNYLCELKELQIRDGLHVLGDSPEGEQLENLLVALTRLPRGTDADRTASLLRALARDLEFADFDPLDCPMGDAWTGPRPQALASLPLATWRSQGDTVERLERLALDLVAGRHAVAAHWSHTRAVLEEIEQHIRPAVAACGKAEVSSFLTALDGRFVDPGPSGAPTRGRVDVLPTGRNFYSVDSRVVPTPAAWQLGWKSAALLLERYRQDHGEWPKTMALSAWGTANMRTGGDDIAQALALLGVKPKWELSSRRVTGFEVLPLAVLDRPRVDVTLRISGFFRDAFPAQIDLVDSAVRAVAALDEAAHQNPIAAQVTTDASWLQTQGVDANEARTRAAYRVFGSKPGAYGAGLQALIDERGWQDTHDLARAYIGWSGYAYGSGASGRAEHRVFERRLQQVQAVLHNQDNREHDLLDSDDYYQFEGGLSAAVLDVTGTRPHMYHNDHSRPESPRIRTLEEEIARVVRARVINPKWIDGVKRHGYKGAFEIAATVDYLFAFAATTGAVRDHHFDLVYGAFIEDNDTRAFLQDNNAHALRDIAERLLEAQTRGLWQSRLNSAKALLESLVIEHD